MKRCLLLVSITCLMIVSVPQLCRAISIEILVNGEAPGGGLNPSAVAPPALADYIYYGVFPSYENSTLPFGSWIQGTVTIPGATTIDWYILVGTNPSSDALMCGISTFEQTAEQPVWTLLQSGVSNGDEIGLSVIGEGPALVLNLFVGDNGDYTFWGPMAFERSSPCADRPGPTIPTLAHAGLAALAALLAASGVWVVIRRRRGI